MRDLSSCLAAIGDMSITVLETKRHAQTEHVKSAPCERIGACIAIFSWVAARRRVVARSFAADFALARATSASTVFVSLRRAQPVIAAPHPGFLAMWARAPSGPGLPLKIVHRARRTLGSR
jgi:hypothetical protein